VVGCTLAIQLNGGQEDQSKKQEETRIAVCFHAKKIFARRPM